MSIARFPREGQERGPWLLLLFAVPVPLVLCLFFFVKWYQQKGEFVRLKEQFLQRQNAVLAHSALSVAVGFSDLLEKASRDVQVFAAFPPTAESLLRFHRAQLGDFTRYDSNNTAVIQEPLPFYNRLEVLDLKGTSLVRFENGAIQRTPRPLGACLEKNLCDRSLYEKAIAMKPGETRYGRLLRLYTPQGVAERTKGAGLAIAFRTEKNVYVLVIDYLHLRDHLTTPSFPYDPKRDLEQAYRKGNYIYIVDDEYNVITHPLPWVQAGIDPDTGEWMPPMLTDEENGRRPINIAAYQGTRMKEYFERLVKVSFTSKSIDLFRASNLAGTNRVLSVVPIELSKGQYRPTGIFGHAVIGCNVDYFEEPKERVVPYY